MPPYITSNLNDVTQLEGVYGVNIPPPAPIRKPGTDWMGYVGHFAWGPVDVRTTIDSTAQYLDLFAPAGQGYAYTGHKSLARTQPAQLKVVRIMAGGAAIAKSTFQDIAAGAKCMIVTAKYYGALPLTIAISAATNGQALCFDLKVTCGTESETYTNLQAMSGAYVVGVSGSYFGDQTNSKFLAQIVVGAAPGAATRPVNATDYVLGQAHANATDLVAGADGSPAAADYLGTAGTGNRGLALFEGDSDVTIVCPDMATNGIRAAINAGFLAHSQSYGKWSVLCQDSGTSNADARTGAAGLRDKHVIGTWPWAYQLNASSALELVPANAFVAAALTHMPRHLGTHWKDPRNTKYYSGIRSLEYVAGRAALILSRNAGLECIVQTDAGGFAPKSGVSTSVTAGETDVATTRITDYIMRGITSDQEPYEGGPIDPVTLAEQIARVKNFLQPMKDNATNGQAAITEAISDFVVWEASSAADLALGLHKIGVKVQSMSPQNFIAFLLTVGPSVTVEQITT